MRKNRSSASGVLSSKATRVFGLSAAVWLSAGLAQSYDTAQAASSSATPQKFALLIGITEYDEDRNGGMRPLNGCVNDVNAMEKALREGFEFKPANIKTLLNKDATHRGIVEAFRNFLIANARKHPNAHVLFYYSGHGAFVPDVPDSKGNRDEADGNDETIVPYDGFRDPEGKAAPNLSKGRYDILDDQIDILYRELAAHTTNITFIFDSCHSGTVTRGPREPDMPLIKEAPPDDRAYPTAIQMPGMEGLKESPASKGASAQSTPLERAPLVSRGGNFVALAGCLPQEQSLDGLKDGSQEQGVLTYYLLQAMKEATPDTTAGEVWARLAPAVTGYALSKHTHQQHPQIEGKGSARFLGGADPRRSPIPPAEYEVRGDQVVIKRGLLAGARTGGYAALSSANAKGGESVKVRLTRVENERAFAAKPKTDIPAKGTARLVTPFFGNDPLKVRLDLANRPQAATEIKDAFANSDHDLIQLVETGGDVVVRFHEGRSDFYVSAGEKVLFNWFGKERDGQGISTNNREDLLKALENFAHQRNLQGLSNPQSELKNAIEFTVLQVKGHVQDGEFHEDPPGNETKVQVSNGVVDFPQGIGYKFRVRNTSNDDLYACVIGLSTDGGVVVLRDRDSFAQSFVLKATDNPKTERVREDSGTTITVYTAPPGGADTFKVLVSKTPITAAYLERDPVAIDSGTKGAGGLGSMLDLLAMDAAQVRSIGGTGATQRENPSFDDWDVLSLTVQTGQAPVKAIMADGK